MPYVHFGSFWIVVIFVYNFCMIFCSNATVLLSSWTMLRSVVFFPHLISHSYCSFQIQTSPFKYGEEFLCAAVIHISHLIHVVVTLSRLSSSIFFSAFFKKSYLFIKSEQELIWIRMAFFEFVAMIPSVFFTILGISQTIQNYKA